MYGVCDGIVNSLGGGDVCANFEEGRHPRRERHDLFLFFLLALAFLFWRWVGGDYFCFGGFENGG